MSENNNNNDVLVLKVKMKGFLLAGILSYIDVAEKKIVKNDCIVVNGGTLLSRFEVNRAHNVLLDSLFSIKLRNEKYDLDYTNQFNEIFMTEVNTPNIIKKIIKAADNRNIPEIEKILTDILKYTVTNHFQLLVDTEFTNIDVSSIETKESAAKEMMDKAYEIEPITAPIKGIQVVTLKKGDVIHVRFIDNSPMGLQIKESLIQTSNEEIKGPNKNPKVLGTVAELLPVKKKNGNMMQILVELTADLYGKMEVPISVKLKQYDPSEQTVINSQQNIPNQSNENQETGNEPEELKSNSSIILFGIIGIIIVILLLMLILK